VSQSQRREAAEVDMHVPSNTPRTFLYNTDASQNAAVAALLNHSASRLLQMEEECPRAPLIPSWGFFGLRVPGIFPDLPRYFLARSGESLFAALHCDCLEIDIREKLS
jgi:hypothetical protein